MNKPLLAAVLTCARENARKPLTFVWAKNSTEKLGELGIIPWNSPENYFTSVIDHPSDSRVTVWFYPGRFAKFAYNTHGKPWAIFSCFRISPCLRGQLRECLFQLVGIQ